MKDWLYLILESLAYTAAVFGVIAVMRILGR